MMKSIRSYFSQNLQSTALGFQRAKVSIFFYLMCKISIFLEKRHKNGQGCVFHRFAAHKGYWSTSGNAYELEGKKKGVPPYSNLC